MDIAIEDWDAMFRAVESRLSHAVSQLFTTVSDVPAPDPLHSIRIIVLECVEALGQLHNALKHERAQSVQRELQAAAYASTAGLNPAAPP